MNLITSIPPFYLESAPAVGRTGACSLDNFQGDPIQIAELKELAKTRASIIILNPASGAGKTHLAIGFMLESFKLDQVREPIYENVIHQKENGAEVSRREQVGWSTKSARAEDYLYIRAEELIARTSKAGFDSEDNYNALVKLRCVLIDEMSRTPLGFGKDALNDRPLMTRFLGEREDWKRQTIITSPMALKDFKTRFDFSIIRRIEDGGGRVIELKTSRFRKVA